MAHGNARRGAGVCVCEGAREGGDGDGDRQLVIFVASGRGEWGGGRYGSLLCNDRSRPQKLCFESRFVREREMTHVERRQILCVEEQLDVG